MNAYDTLLVISHLRKLGTQPSALLHSSLGRLPVPSASLGLPGLWRVWIKDVQRLILTHFDPHLEYLATKEFGGSSLHRNPKWPGSTVIWQYWNIEIMLVGTLACLKFSHVMIFHESCTRVSMFWQLALVFLAISLIISKGSRENCQVVVRISWNDSAAPMTRTR